MYVSPAPSQDRAFAAAAVLHSRTFPLTRAGAVLCSCSRAHGQSHGKSFPELLKESRVKQDEGGKRLQLVVVWQAETFLLLSLGTSVPFYIYVVPGLLLL